MNKKIRTGLMRLRVLAISFIFIFTSFAFSITAFAAFDLTAAALGDSQIKLQWTWVNGAKYCEIYRNGIADPVKSIDIAVDLNYLSYTDSGLEADTTYDYRVDMLDSNRVLLDSSVVSAATVNMSAPVAISAAFNVNSTGGGNYQITMKWRNSSASATGNIIMREDGTAVATIDDVTPYTISGVSTYTFTDNFTAFGQQVKYVVASKDSKGNISASSNAITVIPVDSPDITASVVNGSAIIAWQNRTGIENFSLERSQYTGTAWGSWLVVNAALSAGSWNVTDALTVSGTYRYQLHAISTSNYRGYSNISSTVVKTLAPTNLSGTVVSMGRIDLTWTNPAGNESNILVERKTGSGAYEAIATLEKSVSSYSDIYAFAANASYTYRVSTYEGESNKSSSNTFTLTISVPAAPGTLNLVIASNTRVDLQWEDKSNNEDGYRIERKTDSGNFVQIGSVNKDVIKYSDTAVTSGHTYTYRVFSYNFIGPSITSTNAASCNTTMVYAPNYLAVSSVTTNAASLVFSYPSGRTYSTLVERRLDSSAVWSSITLLSPGVASYTDTGLTQNTKYYYRVKAMGGSYVYSLPYPNDGIGKEALTKLVKPTGLNAAMLSYTSAILRWTDSSTNETEFVIERKRGTGSYAVVGTVPANTVFWVDTGLSEYYTYTYRLRAKTATNWSDYSDEYTIQMVPLAAPSNLNVSIVSGTSAILNWTDNSTNETGFEVWRKIGVTGTWYLLATVPNDVKVYADNNLSSAYQYYYKVRATSGSAGNYSAYTAEVSVNPGTITAPSSFYIVEFANYFTKLSWTDNSYNETGFVIERKLPGGTYIKIAQTEPNTTSYFDKGLSQQTGYYYRVKAINSSLSSTYSQEIFVMTLKAVTFNDLGSNYTWAREAIGNMATRGIIKGVGSDMFAPGKTITRAEFVALMLRSYKLGSITPSGGFADVPSSKWYYKELTIAKMLGIITGDSNNKYYPDEPIIREDTAIVIANTLRAANKTLPVYNSAVLNVYKDKSAISANAITSMSALVGEGIFVGRTDGNIGPVDTATRAEAAVLIYRVIDKYLP